MMDDARCDAHPVAFDDDDAQATYVGMSTALLVAHIHSFVYLFIL